MSKVLATFAFLLISFFIYGFYISQFELNFEVTSLKTYKKQTYKVSQKTKVLQGFEGVKS